MQPTRQICNGNIDLRWTGYIPKTAIRKYWIVFSMARMCFHTLLSFSSYIKDFFSKVYYLIVCTTGVVKIIFKWRKLKILLQNGIPKLGSCGKCVFASLLNIIIYILRSPTVKRNTDQHNSVVCCFKSPIVSFCWLFSN